MLKTFRSKIVAFLSLITVFTGAYLGAPDLGGVKDVELQNVKNDIVATREYTQAVTTCTEDLNDVVNNLISIEVFNDSCTTENVVMVEYAYSIKEYVSKSNELEKDKKKIKEKRADGKTIETFYGKDKFHEKNGKWYEVEYDSIEKEIFDSTVAVLGIPRVYAQSPETFTTSGTFNVPSGVTEVEVLVVGGGGSGGSGFGGGGGGAGEVIYNSAYSVTPLDAITVTVGTGGAGVVPNTFGNYGTDSSFDGQTANGGGAGGMNSNGGNGGSGGGASGGTSAKSGGSADATCPSGFTCHKYAGGNDPSSGAYISAGGGGAGEVGANSTASLPGDGGDGVAYSISGSSVYYGGGGGGSYSAGDGGAGGLGGGGMGDNGANPDGSDSGRDGTDGLGGGGGGHWTNYGSSGDGGDGVVIVAYDAGGGSTGEEYIMFFQ